MKWFWIGVACYFIFLIFLFSSPRRIRHHAPGVVLGLISGLVVEYALSAARPMWEGASLLVPLFGKEAIWVVLFYATQGLLFFQWMPRLTSLHIPYALVFALGTSLFEVLLSSLSLLNPPGVRGFLVSATVHTLRLAALVGTFHGLRYEERAEALKEHFAAQRTLRLARNLWFVAWPSTALIAFAMLRITQRFARKEARAGPSR